MGLWYGCGGSFCSVTCVPGTRCFGEHVNSYKHNPVEMYFMT